MTDNPPDPIRFTIHGRAAPYSVSTTVRERKGGGGKYPQHYASEAHQEWQLSVAGQALPHRPPGGPWPGGIALWLEFTRVKAKSHPKNPDRCRVPEKKALAVRPIIKPDLLKLARVVEDGLTKTGVFWRDDSQVVRHHFAKQWGVDERVDVLIEFLPLGVIVPARHQPQQAEVV